MSETIKETVTQGEFGDYKLAHGKGGGNWRPITVDEFGNLQIDVLASALPAGAATAAKQDTLEATLTNIETDIAALEVLNTSIKNAVEVIDNFISGTKGLVTEDNSADILAKIIAAPATSAKQDTLETTLTNIETDIAALELLNTDIKTAVELIDNALDAAGDDSLRVLPPEMLTDKLVVTTTAASNAIGAPGIGSQIEVLGYSLAIEKEAPTGTTGSITLEFEDSMIYTFSIPLRAESVTDTELLSATGLRIKGADNEALTLINAAFTGGVLVCECVVYYRIV